MKLYELLCEMAGRLKSIRQLPEYNDPEAVLDRVVKMARTEQGIMPTWTYIEPIPEYNTISDRNKVLSVTSEESPYISWRAVNEVPAVSAETNGKFLKSGTSSCSWEEGSFIPTGGNPGDVLVRTADGYAWSNLSTQLEAIVDNYMQTHYENADTQEY